jgi:hypothetical protein
MATKTHTRKRASMPPTGPGSEHWNQATFVSLIRQVQHPAGQWTFAVPNGFLRTKLMRIRAWREGVVAGIADLCNPYPMLAKGYVGQFIELKTEKGTLSKEQRAFKAAVEEMHWRYDIAYSWRDALDAWAEYLDIRLQITEEQ